MFENCNIEFARYMPKGANFWPFSVLKLGITSLFYTQRYNGSGLSRVLSSMELKILTLL